MNGYRRAAKVAPRWDRSTTLITQRALLIDCALQSLGNDNVVDENNLSEGELELSEAVISVNQYIMQPRFNGAPHFDRSQFLR